MGPKRWPATQPDRCEEPTRRLRGCLRSVKTFGGVDDNRLVIWGTSLSGGHALELGARHPELAGVIVQAPHVNGPATVSQLPPLSLPGPTAAGIDDAGRATLGQAPLHISLTNPTGEFGALTQFGAYEGYQFVQPNPPPPGNVFPARFVLELPFFVPDATNGVSKLPTLFTVGLTDNVTPLGPAIALAKRMSNATLYTYPETAHFNVYPGAKTYEANVGNQLAFLKKDVPI